MEELARLRTYLHKDIFKNVKRSIQRQEQTFLQRVWFSLKSNSLSLHSKDRVSFVDSGAFLHMMDISSLTEQEKRTDRRSSKALNIQTANGMVTKDTQAKVYIRELCAVVWVFLVENSPSVLSLGSCSELGSSLSWPSGGISQSIQRRKG